MHLEGSPWHTLFGLLCYDVIFDPKIAKVWQCPTQAAPLDLNTTDFYSLRRNAFDDRLKWIQGAANDQLLEEVARIWELKFGERNSEISWDAFRSLDQVKVQSSPDKVAPRLSDTLSECLDESYSVQ